MERRMARGVEEAGEPVVAMRSDRLKEGELWGRATNGSFVLAASRESAAAWDGQVGVSFFC
eukprot:1194725-Prorocentrum_minimum.AAC.10